MFGIGPQELIVVLIIALLVFGPKKMPEIGKSIGSALRELRRASNDFMSAIASPEPDEPESFSSFDEPERNSVGDEPAADRDTQGSHEEQGSAETQKEGEQP